jgi:hypothetical protein
MMERSWHYILNAAGEPVEADWLTWAQWFGNADRRIALTKVGDVEISTVFLGLDHGGGTGRPILWETLVFGGDLDGEMNRYHTKMEALRGHELMSQRVRDLHGHRQIDLED